jgi:hypothetical protein
MSDIVFTKDRGWDRFRGAIEPRRFEAVVKRNMERATELNAHLAQAAVRRAIRNGTYAPNASLTIAIKGSSKPLVDHGSGLFQAVTTQKVDATSIFVGVLRSDEQYNIALAIHDGATIGVTPAMRGLFFVLWQASEGAIAPSELSGRAAELWERMPGDWRPLKPSTSAIIIPARPFLVEAFADGNLRRQAQRNWERALQRAMRELAQGGG